MNLDIDKRIGLAIKKLRIKKGFTQHDVAEKQNITYQQVQKYENGKSSIQVKRLYSICRDLGISIEELFRKAFDSFEVAEPEQGYKAGAYLNISVTKDEMRLIKLFRTIKDAKFKEGLMKMLASFEKK